MRNKLLAFILVVALVLCLCACTKTGQDSTFSIHFIDVGQGDSALVECDGHYMLIDGGETTAGEKIYKVLENKGIKRLEYLVISHLHTDHYGGLIKAVTYASSIGRTLANSDYTNSSKFKELEDQLAINGTTITVPHIGDKFTLGSAEIEVIDVAETGANDSLVILITYGGTRFLFTGDIDDSAQTRISDKYQNEKDEPFKITLIKMPHHGSYTCTLYRFLRTFKPEYAIISVGAGNLYGHPDRETIDMLNSRTWTPKVYRTDQNGDIIVRSDGRTLTVETSR